MEWPTTDAEIQQMVDRLPDVIDGDRRGNEPPPDESEFTPGGVYIVDYLPGCRSCGGHRTIAITRVPDGDSPAQDLVGVLGWGGGPSRCVDASYSDAFAPMFERGNRALMHEFRALGRLRSDEFLWFACTGTYDGENGVKLSADEWDYLLMWNVGDWSYGIEAGSSHQRAEMVRALTEAASGH